MDNNYYSNNQSVIGIEASDVIELDNILFNYDSTLINNINRMFFSFY